MTEKQLDISDAMLKYLATHENRVNRSALTRALKEQFGAQSALEIAFVYDCLEKDYGLIRPLGEAFVALTADGMEMARRGMRNYKQKLKLKEQFKVAGKAIGIIASIAAILSFFLGLLF